MGAYVQGLEQARAAAAKKTAAMKAKFRTNIEKLVREIDTEIKARTPVYSGQAVRNMIWQMGTPFNGVLDAIDNGPTGHTSSMALGSEPRRGVNEAAAAQSLDTLDFSNPFQKFILANNSPDIEGLELGLLPGAPLSSRAPHGMFRVTQVYISTKISAKGMLS